MPSLLSNCLRLGTRKSLLAWAQSSWVAREVERLNPGVQVELFGIETRGDRIQNVSLQKIEGKEFFVAEIDEALRAGHVDFTVHSLKDLSLERPDQFFCGAIPVRENPRDIVLFGPQILERLKKNEILKFGTSSPRRIENVPGFLRKSLPRLGSPDQEPQLEFVEIRGNVNTRLSRIQNVPNSSKYLDGVVLAFAGIIRLWKDPNGRLELKKLLSGVRWMILPLQECPAAPGQGALAIECREADTEIRKILRKLHHLETEMDVKSERKLLSDWGGGCHQRFGATSLQLRELGSVLFIRGSKPAGERVEELCWNVPTKLKTVPAHIWDGTQWRTDESEKIPDDLSEFPHPGEGAVFVTHARSVSRLGAVSLQKARVWTSGVKTWFKLATRGVWVEGCAEGFGFDFLRPQLSEPVLNLPQLSQWSVLTHLDGLEEWTARGIPAFATYKINKKYGFDARSALLQASFIFWSSGSQFDELKESISQIREGQVRHACGPGKTAVRLRDQGLIPEVFPSVDEWRKWIYGKFEKARDP